MTTRTQLADPRTLRKAAAGRKMNKAEAQELTAQIRAQGHLLWRLVAEAYDRKAWQALGYTGWKEYATVELDMSESRSYQLVDTGRVMRAIGEVAGEGVFDQLVVTARETAKVKPHLSTFKREVQKGLKAGLDAPQAVDAAIASLPETEKRPTGPRAPRADVVEGEIVSEQAPVVLPDLGAITRVPAPAAARPVPAPLFSAPEDPEQTFTRPRPPKGKKVCTACEGHGYV